MTSERNIGTFLARLRREKDWTQQEAADRLGISNRTLSSWENGRRYPDILMLPALAKLYGVTTDELLEGHRATEEPPEEPAPAVPDGRARRERRTRAALEVKECVLAVLFAAGLGLMFLGGSLSGWLTRLTVAGLALFIPGALLVLITAALTVPLGRLAEADCTAEEAPALRRCVRKYGRIECAALFVYAVLLAVVSAQVSMRHGVLLPAQLALMGIALLLAVTGCLLSARGAKRDALKEGEAACVRYRERRALSVRLFSVVGAVALVAAAAIILFTHWQPRTEEVLLRAETRTELARAMESVELTEDDLLVQRGELEAGVIYLDLVGLDGGRDWAAPHILAYLRGDRAVILHQESGIVLAYADEVDGVYNVRCTTLHRHDDPADEGKSEGILPVEWGEAIVEKGGSFALVRYRIHDCQTLVTVLGIALLLLDTAAAAVIWPLSMRRSG